MDQIGRTILAKVVHHYRSNPDSWTRGWGTLAAVMNEDAETVQSSLDDGAEDGCIETMITCFATTCVGPVARDTARDAAMKILRDHHGLDDQGIRGFNDVCCNGVDDTITFIEDALHAGRSQTSHRMREMATAALGMVIGTSQFWNV